MGGCLLTFVIRHSCFVICASRDRAVAVDRHWQDEAVVVVDMLTNKIHATGGRSDPTWVVAVSQPKVVGCPLDKFIQQHIDHPIFTHVALSQSVKISVGNNSDSTAKPQYGLA